MKVQFAVRAEDVRKGDEVAGEIGRYVVLSADVVEWNPRYTDIVFDGGAIQVPSKARLIVLRDVL